MSDYLWDKTGEPEEDVAQLEQLLGALKHQPRPLDIPATAMPAAGAARTRPATILTRPRLAIAASLLLTLLAGAWFVTRQDEPQPDRLAKVEQGSVTGGSERTAATAVAPNAGTDGNAPAGEVRQPQPQEDEAIVLTASDAGTHRPSRRLVAKRRKLPGRVEQSARAPREEIAAGGALRWQVEQPLTPQQREATEQLMLALRLASAKLNYAQREMQEIGRAGK
jgi:hypothetical protein